MPPIVSQPAKMAKEPSPLRLQFLPVEVLTVIYGDLDMKHALRLARSNKLLRAIYESNSIRILGPILMREFSPLDGLLRLVARDDFEVPFSAWFNRRIKFAGWLISDDNRFADVPEIRFKQEHMPEVMKVVKAVSMWEAVFPRLRFAELAEERRRLRPHEKARLRCALYNLWRYANSYHQHHDDYDASFSWAMSPEQGEVRANSLRLLSTMELYELQDLWKTIQAAVTTQLCPSVSLLLRNEVSLSLVECKLQSLTSDRAIRYPISILNSGAGEMAQRTT
jgi:hypothetical protein